MKKIKIKSYCKLNLSLRVSKKKYSNLHNIKSLITFCDLYDLISIRKIKSLKDKIIFTGKFKKGINKKSNTITRVLQLLREKNFLKNYSFEIIIKKNIPHGSGMGGGSSNAASILNFFKNRMNLKLNKTRIRKLANQIGFDVPICLEKKNTILTGKSNEILRLNQRFGLNVLIIYPRFICSTKKIYKYNKQFTFQRDISVLQIKDKNKIIDYLRHEVNDLEKTVIEQYPKIKTIINFIKSQKGCYFSRITGSGSACIGIFSNMKTANFAQKLAKLKFTKYWCVISKTI